MKSQRPAKRPFPEALEAACHDPENCSIDPVVKLALSDDPQTYQWALPLLRNMAEFKRDEAAVFLIGLLLRTMVCAAYTGAMTTLIAARDSGIRISGHLRALA